jgi:hypothetical protein
MSETEIPDAELTYPLTTDEPCDWDGVDGEHTRAMFNVGHNGSCGFDWSVVCPACLLARLVIPKEREDWKIEAGQSSNSRSRYIESYEDAEERYQQMVTFLDYDAGITRKIPMDEAVERAKAAVETV